MQFVFVGFITHYAAQRYEWRHLTGGPALSHGDSLDRLAGALRSVDVSIRGRTGEPIPFIGCGADLAGVNEIFETPYGTVHVVTEPTGFDLESHGSPEGGRIRIAIGCPTDHIRACVASRQFDAELNQLLEIIKLFEQSE
ncbi:hypothetical protein IU474_33185 [Nocardia otitidiscaviarum]|uniref:hypothetical protein n=1 Tax=Nocardia otitidiscaviarum TaxID=1823 RepID=UPI0018941564|nr:hypothetical protein [Nocardia otitidiscaviarum]MBF6241904.1 hypothetical protein [Nocardia otitidiscaviarum]